MNGFEKYPSPVGGESLKISGKRDVQKVWNFNRFSVGGGSKSGIKKYILDIYGKSHLMITIIYNYIYSHKRRSIVVTEYTKTVTQYSTKR